MWIVIVLRCKGRAKSLYCADEKRSLLENETRNLLCVLCFSFICLFEKRVNLNFFFMYTSLFCIYIKKKKFLYTIYYWFICIYHLDILDYYLSYPVTFLHKLKQVAVDSGEARGRGMRAQQRALANSAIMSQLGPLLVRYFYFVQMLL